MYQLNKNEIGDPDTTIDHSHFTLSLQNELLWLIIVEIISLILIHHYIYKNNNEIFLYIFSKAFRIHVSPTTKSILDILGGYHLQLRGKVELKGKGLVDSFWLIGKDNFNKPLPDPPPLTE